MSPWLVKGGHRAQLLPFHEASQHVSRPVPSSVNAPPTHLLTIATRNIRIEVPEDNDTVMQWRIVQEIFQFVQDVCCGWMLSPAVWDIHTYHKQVTLVLAIKGNVRLAAASIHTPGCTTDGSIATPAYLSSAGVVSPVRKRLLGHKWHASCVVRLSKSQDVVPKWAHSSRCVYERPRQFHVARVRAKTVVASGCRPTCL